VLVPPMVDATVWQWPINTLNLANTNMACSCSVRIWPGQARPRAAVVEKDGAGGERRDDP
jgi:hypothetical protein